MIFQNTAPPRKILIKPMCDSSVAALYQLQFLPGSVYVMNGFMQEHYVYSVPKVNSTIPVKASDQRIILVFCNGDSVNVIDNGIPTSMDVQINKPSSVTWGYVNNIEKEKTYS